MAPNSPGKVALIENRTFSHWNIQMRGIKHISGYWFYINIKRFFNFPPLSLNTISFCVCFNVKLCFVDWIREWYSYRNPSICSPLCVHGTGSPTDPILCANGSASQQPWGPPGCTSHTDDTNTLCCGGPATPCFGGASPSSDAGAFSSIHML